jgi:hypothetical protein
MASPFAISAIRGRRSGTLATARSWSATVPLVSLVVENGQAEDPWIADGYDKLAVRASQRLIDGPK